MADAKSLNQVLKAEADKASAAKVKEDAAAARKKPEAGKVAVRLTRPMYGADGRYYPAGIHMLDKAVVPKTAVQLTAAPPVSDETDD